jgi:hypothetical protein
MGDTAAYATRTPPVTAADHATFPIIPFSPTTPSFGPKPPGFGRDGGQMGGPSDAPSGAREPFKVKIVLAQFETEEPTNAIVDVTDLFARK